MYIVEPEAIPYDFIHCARFLFMENHVARWLTGGGHERRAFIVVAIAI